MQMEWYQNSKTRRHSILVDKKFVGLDVQMMM